MKTLIYSLLLLLTMPLSAGQPKLIVQLVVDQLRGDLLQQYHKEFSAAGFNYLLDHSINYQNAHHPHANTVTCVGHATIATGAFPTLHGVIANEWFDRTHHKTVSCMEDQSSKILPTSRSHSTLEGRSPRNLLASTLSDELILAQKGRAFAVAFKDRSAITLGGHAGKALWFDKENGGFVSSSHYYSEYPQWVMEWNKRYQPANKTWSLGKSIELYHYAKAPRFAHRFPAFGQDFPHHLGNPTAPDYYKYLSMTPFVDEMAADFAIKLLHEEKLGLSEDKTDYLAISFSAVDAIGHQFGPNSVESEDNLLRLDGTIAKLLAAINEQVGLKNTLIVLTADHGISDSSAYLDSHNLYENHVLTTQTIQDTITTALAKRFQLPRDTLVAIDLPYIYLDHRLITDKQLTVHTVAAYLTQIVRELPGVFQVYTLPLDNIEPDWLSAKVDKMAYVERAGDLYIVPPPYQALADKAEQRVAHGTPWNYDSYVPLLFINPQFTTQKITRAVTTNDIAPTLAALLEIKAPSAATGQPLAEVVENTRKPVQ